MVHRISLLTLLASILHLGLAGFAQAAPLAPIHISGEGAKSVYALVIGISTYKDGKSENATGRFSLVNLNWAANDALKFSQYLLSQGVPEANIRLLRDDQAFKGAFEDGFQWLLDKQAQANLLVFYYSGHGATFIPDTDGDEAMRTPGDCFDEALLPYDTVDIYQHSDKEIVDPQLQKSYYASMFIDDEFSKYLSEIKVPSAVILDSCFSGGAVRGFSSDAEGLDIRAKAQLTPKNPESPQDCDVMKAVLGIKYFKNWVDTLTPEHVADGITGVPPADNSCKMDLPSNVTALMACLENQESEEVTRGSIDGGAFTHFLLNALQNPNQSDRNHDGWVDLKEAFITTMENMMTESIIQPQQPDIANDELAASIDLTPTH